MKNFKIILVALFIVAIGCPMIGWAHDKRGTLGADASATDFYKITCSDDGRGPAGKLSLDAENVSAPNSAPLNVQIFKDDHNLYMSTTDNVGEDNQTSPSLTAIGGSGNYSVLVDKSGVGKVKYSLDFHCETLGGVHTGTDIRIEQDQ